MEDRESAIGSAAALIGSIALRIIVTAVMVLCIFVAVRYCYRFGHDIFYQEPAEKPPGTDFSLTVSEGDTLTDVAAELKKMGVIENEKAFRIQGILYKTHIYPGEYVLNTSMTTKELHEKINLSEEEYESKAAQMTAAADEGVSGGSDLVDEAQARAAAGEGIRVETDANPGGGQ